MREDPTPSVKDVQQAPRLRLLQAVLRCCQDPDAEALDAYCWGVRLGFQRRMPHARAFFNETGKRRLHYEPGDTPADLWAPNYKIARERVGFLETKIKEDFHNKRMIQMSHKDAKERYGDRLLLGAMGVVEEGSGKFHFINEGTRHTMINHRIGARGHVPGPMVGDIAAMLKDAEDENEKLLGLVWDFTSAHQAVAAHEDDWGLQACTLADLRGKVLGDDVDVYLNTVGAFGFSTAGHWWGRLAAMLITVGHYILGHTLAGRIMIFVDDGMALLPVTHFRKSAVALFAFYA